MKPAAERKAELAERLQRAAQEGTADDIAQGYRRLHRSVIGRTQLARQTRPGSQSWRRIHERKVVPVRLRSWRKAASSEPYRSQIVPDDLPICQRQISVRAVLKTNPSLRF